MHASWGTLASRLLISITLLVPDSLDSVLQYPEQKEYPLPLEEVTVIVSAQIGTKALLSCTSITFTKAKSVTWIITFRGQPSCRISNEVETKDTVEKNCRDTRIALTHYESPDLQINPVALNHDGHYTCEIDGLRKAYDLQVLVPPEVALFPGGSGTAVCEAIAGKPAAQIFWNPDGHCVSKNESHSNGTVTVRSTCRWEQNYMRVVICFVSHLTGSKLLSMEQNGGTSSTLGSLMTILYVKLSLLGIFVLILGFVFFQKRKSFRK